MNRCSCRLLRRRPDKPGGSSAPGQAPWKAPMRRRARHCRRRRRGAAPAGGRRRGKAAGAGKTGRVSSSAWWTSFARPPARPPCRFSGGCGAVRETGGMAAFAGRAVAMQGHQNPNLLIMKNLHWFEKSQVIFSRFFLFFAVRLLKATYASTKTSVD